jgi:hypothetical protein
MANYYLVVAVVNGVDSDRGVGVHDEGYVESKWSATR